MTTRTPTDYALEFAEYLAKGAENLLKTLNDKFEAEEAAEDDDSPEAQAKLEHALECLGEAQSKLLSNVYEFRRRAERAKATK